MKVNSQPIADPSVVFRQEFEDWAVLFDPDSGMTHGLDFVGISIWECLDGRHTVDAILAKIRTDCHGVPYDAKEHIENFLLQLKELGYVTW
jgi:SynChlorMet cassette protein ScmD